MTVTPTNNNQAGANNQPPDATIRRVSPEAQRRASEAHEDAEYNRQLKGWENTLRREISKSLFPKMQFTPSSKDEEFGSDWQRACCHKTQVPRKFRKRFWQQGGRVIARSLLNRRRQNAALTMKTQFVSE
jgi:hypothetical protein